MPIHSVIFDLDGTLIDSAPSILKSIEAAFKKVGIEPANPLVQDIIGPPLKEIFTKLVDEVHKEKINQLIEGFKKYYDASGYKETRAYEAVAEMLDELSINGLRLYIATNKRLIPTLKIIDHLGWESKFEEIYALDYFEPIMPNKMAMLQRLCKDIPNATNDAAYIGDRSEDADAAGKAELPFFLATWGYGGDDPISRDTPRIAHPSMLYNAIRKYL
jgi:phosphoglycolate phosphatase